MTPSLKNPKLKVERAGEHLQYLYTKLDEFQKIKPFSFSDHEDSVRGYYIRRLDIPIIDTKLALIAGEITYSLRSALDNAAWQLALLTTDNPFDRTCFPIIDRDNAQKLKKFKEITRDIPADAVKEIEALQPYL